MIHTQWLVNGRLSSVSPHNGRPRLRTWRSMVRSPARGLFLGFNLTFSGVFLARRINRQSIVPHSFRVFSKKVTLIDIASGNSQFSVTHSPFSMIHSVVSGDQKSPKSFLPKRSRSMPASDHYNEALSERKSSKKSFPQRNSVRGRRLRNAHVSPALRSGAVCSWRDHDPERRPGVFPGKSAWKSRSSFIINPVGERTARAKKALWR